MKLTLCTGNRLPKRDVLDCDLNDLSVHRTKGVAAIQIDYKLGLLTKK